MTTPIAPLPSEDIFVARQPVFDRSNNVWGYELLFRASGDAPTANVDNPDQATLQVIADGFTLAMDGIAPGQKALINFPRNLLVDDSAFALPSDVAVIEILEDVRPEPDVMASLQAIKKAGFSIALDDFMGEDELVPFIKVADIIKVDVLGIIGSDEKQDIDRLREITKDLSKTGRLLLAEKVEDNDIFELCKELGFSLFQGFFFSKPKIIPGKKISPSELTKLQLLKELGNENFETSKLADTLRLDPSLSYRLFRFINSASMGVSQKVESVTRAITLLGQRQLQQWLRIVILTDLAPTQRGQQATFLSVQRGRFLELMSKHCPAWSNQHETMFLLGLFSLLDAVLGQRMETIVEQVTLDKSVGEALLGKTNDYADGLRLVQAYERNDWETVQDILEAQHFDRAKADALYTQSLHWTQQLIGSNEK